MEFALTEHFLCAQLNNNNTTYLKGVLMNKYEQLIEAIISEDEAKAKELFHQIVVEKSRDIYESLMDEEMTDEEADTEELADDVEADEVSEEFDITAEEAKSLMDYVDSGLAEGVDADLLERVAAYFGVDSTGLLSKLEESSDQLLDIAYGAPVAEEGEEEMSDMDMEMPAGEKEEGEEAGEAEEEELEDRVMDLESALDELKAEFDALMADEAGEEEHNDGVNDPEMGDEEAEEEMAEEAEEEVAEEEAEEEVAEEVAVAPKARPTNDLDIMREYVEKVSAPSNQEGADNKQSTVAGKNDMGGDAGNTAQGGEESGRPAPKAAPIASGNKNVPGGKAGLEKA